ncbi:MAG: orotidine-5-phosphate decarboxylase [Gaiellaceae bacterium]|nr:orotidine-5-phosphate decarboxylase [Gaiellaceae bacterium]
MPATPQERPGTLPYPGSVMRFADRLAEAVEEKGAPLCVGIDPDPALMPAGVGLREFCRGIVDAVAPVAAVVKPQTAFFEAHGATGWAALEDVCAYARDAGLLVLVDGKRGDVPSTMQAYAAALAPLADAVTVNPYLGEDSLGPFLAHDGLGIFAIVKTSNPGSADLQDVPLVDGRPFWHHVAERVEKWGIEAVVGATHPEVLADARSLMPRAVLLLPGVGAQGGRIEDLAPAFAPGPASALPTASRSVIYADDPRAAAAALSQQLRSVLSAVT